MVYQEIEKCTKPINKIVMPYLFRNIFSFSPLTLFFLVLKHLSLACSSIHLFKAASIITISILRCLLGSFYQNKTNLCCSDLGIGRYHLFLFFDSIKSAMQPMSLVLIRVGNFKHGKFSFVSQDTDLSLNNQALSITFLALVRYWPAII